MVSAMNVLCIVAQSSELVAVSEWLSYGYKESQLLRNRGKKSFLCFAKISVASQCLNMKNSIITFTEKPCM